MPAETVICQTCFWYDNIDTRFYLDSAGLRSYRLHIHTHEAAYWASVGKAVEFADLGSIVNLRLLIMTDWLAYSEFNIEIEWNFENFATLQMIDNAVRNFYHEIQADLGSQIDPDSEAINERFEDIEADLSTVIYYDTDWIAGLMLEIEIELEDAIKYDDEWIIEWMTEWELDVATAIGFDASDIERRLGDIEWDLEFIFLRNQGTMQLEIYALNDRVNALEQKVTAGFWDTIIDLIDAITGGIAPVENDISAWMQFVNESIWQLSEDIIALESFVKWDLPIAMKSAIGDVERKFDQEIADIWIELNKEVDTEIGGPGPEGPRGPSGSRGPAGPKGDPGRPGPKATLADIDNAIFNNLFIDLRALGGSTAGAINFIWQYAYDNYIAIDYLFTEGVRIAKLKLDERITEIETELEMPEITHATIAHIPIEQWNNVMLDFQEILARTYGV